MTLTSIPPSEAATAARRDFAGALFDAGLWFERNRNTRLPASPVINVRVHGGDRDAKLADLRAIAASWEVPVTTQPDGTQYAERVFGPLTIEAHVPAEYAGATAWLDSAKARRAESPVAA
jgi:hypothetical protein